MLMKRLAVWIYVERRAKARSHSKNFIMLKPCFIKILTSIASMTWKVVSSGEIWWNPSILPSGMAKMILFFTRSPYWWCLTQIFCLFKRRKISVSNDRWFLLIETYRKMIIGLYRWFIWCLPCFSTGNPSARFSCSHPKKKCQAGSGTTGTFSASYTGPRKRRAPNKAPDMATIHFDRRGILQVGKIKGCDR